MPPTTVPATLDPGLASPSFTPSAPAPLIDLIDRCIAGAEARGHVGIALIRQPGAKRPYLAACLGRDGRPADPRSWDYHPTVRDALDDLARRL